MWKLLWNVVIVCYALLSQFWSLVNCFLLLLSPLQWIDCGNLPLCRVAELSALGLDDLHQDKRNPCKCSLSVGSRDTFLEIECKRRLLLILHYFSCSGLWVMYWHHQTSIYRMLAQEERGIVGRTRGWGYAKCPELKSMIHGFLA